MKNEIILNGKRYEFCDEDVTLSVENEGKTLRILNGGYGMCVSISEIK